MSFTDAAAWILSALVAGTVVGLLAVLTRVRG